MCHKISINERTVFTATYPKLANIVKNTTFLATLYNFKMTITENEIKKTTKKFNLFN